MKNAAAPHETPNSDPLTCGGPTRANSVAPKVPRRSHTGIAQITPRIASSTTAATLYDRETVVRVLPQ